MKKSKNHEKMQFFFQDFEHFFNFKRLYSKNKEKFESAIWLKRCAWVSTFMRTSIESLKIKNKTYGHFCIKKNKKPGLERPLECYFSSSNFNCSFFLFSFLGLWYTKLGISLCKIFRKYKTNWFKTSNKWSNFNHKFYKWQNINLSFRTWFHKWNSRYILWKI